MNKKFIAGMLAAGILYLPLSAEAYDTKPLQLPQNPFFYLYETQVDFNIKEQLQRAKSLIEDEKDYRMAIAVCNQIIELDPNVSLAYLFKSFALTEMKNYSAAEDECQKAINIESENPTFYYFKAMNYLYWADNFDKGNSNHRYYSDRAVDEFHNALNFEKKYINAIIGVGDAYMRKADYNRACISIDGGYRRKDAIENYNKAIDEYNKVLVLFPKNSAILAKKSIAQNALAEVQN